MKKKSLIYFGMILLIGILFINLVSAVEVSYCCERLKNNGAWCQNALSSECATGTNPITGESYKQVPTSCESTAYCKLGTCVNSIQGSCMPNTPQVVCNTNGGIWKEAAVEDLPECQLGCCLMGNQAAFVTQVECKKLSSEQGLTTNYRKDITTELECIASISTDEMGACVFEKDFERTCLMLTQRECNEMKTSSESGLDKESVSFHGGYLCSAPQLSTNCGPRGGTKCENEQVYFTDTCGNIANVYDYSKLNDNNDYWTYIQEPSCDDGTGNKNSRTCGACDYYSGSICNAYGKEQTIKPNYGNFVCQSLDCTYQGQKYLHGETWCEDNSKGTLDGQSLPGSRNYRMLCYNGEVSIEPCSDFRNEICISSEINSYSTAGCVPNRKEDCTAQISKEMCEDIYSRDCKWVTGFSILKDENGADFVFDNETGAPSSCVPKFAPGFDFWVGEGAGAELCNMASTACNAKYEIGILRSKNKLARSDWDERIGFCVENCYCLPGYRNGQAKDKYEDDKPAWHPKSYDEWVKTMNNVCTALGDCGNKNNYLGYSGEVKDVFTSEFIKG